MPLEPNKVGQKRSGTQQAVLFAAEWSAIIFAAMLAVFFLSWALALQPPLGGASQTSTDTFGAFGRNLQFSARFVDRGSAF
jgi:hypothetical protein